MTRLTATVRDRIAYEPGECWLWTGAYRGDGYGVLWGRRADGHNTGATAHRVVYEQTYGRPVPDGMHLHHTCHNKGCVNPARVVPLTPGDHGKEHAADRTHCVNGHPWAETGTYVAGIRGRRCAACHRNRARERYARRRDQEPNA